MFVEWKTNMRALCFSRQVFTPLLTISTNILRVLHNQYMHVSYRLLNFLSLIIKLDGKFTRSVHILNYCWYTVSENPIHSLVISLALLLHCHRSIRSVYSFCLHSILKLNRVDGSSISSLETVTGRAWTGLRIQLMKGIMIKRTILGFAYEK